MSPKRAVLYGAALLLLGAVVYLAWPRAAVRAPDAADPGSGAPRRSGSSSGLGVVIRAGSGARAQLAVSGTVRDASTGKGIAAVMVTFRAGDGIGQATTSSTGSYRVELPAGLYEVSLKAEEHSASVAQPAVLIQDEPVSGLDFWLQRTGSVAGLVVDVRGKPLRDVLVTVHSHSPEARSTGPAESGRGITRSDAKGRFTLRVPPGEVVLRADGQSLGAALSKPIYVQPGMHLSGVEIVLGAGGALAGRVLRPDGTGAAGAEILIKDELGLRRMPSDSQGRFAAGGLLPGTKQLQAVARGFAPSQVTEVQVQLGPARGRVNLQLGAAKGVAGRVVSPEGAPVPRARVSVTAGGPGGPLSQLGAPPDVLTDESGSFQFLEVPNLPLTLTARGLGTARASRSGVAPGSQNVVLKLEATGSIVGQVTEGEHGRPVPDFTVTLTAGPGIGRGSQRPALRVASSKGQFAVDDLLPGSYALTITSPGYGPAEKRGLAVVAGHAARADTVLDGAGRISGLVVDSRGAGVPGASLRVDSGWAGLPVVSDASGSFLIRDVARGRRSLSVTHPEFNTRVLGGVSVFAGETATVRVELSAREGSQPGLNLTGIGATLTNQKGRLVVIEPLKGSPAEIAGLRAGDQIIAVDGEDAGKMSFGEAIEALRGVSGTPVRVRVRRGEQSFELYIIRGDVKVPSGS